MTEELGGNLTFLLSRSPSNLVKKPPRVLVGPSRRHRAQIHVPEELNQPALRLSKFLPSLVGHIGPGVDVGIHKPADRLYLGVCETSKAAAIITSFSSSG